MFVVAIIILLVLLLASALISGTEVAFFSLSKTDIINISEDGWFGDSIGPDQHFSKSIFTLPVACAAST